MSKRKDNIEGRRLDVLVEILEIYNINLES